MSWKSSNEPPEFSPTDPWWPASVPVLVYTRFGIQMVATYEQVDEDYPPRWRSACSEGWDITKSVTHWMPLPDPPTNS